MAITIFYNSINVTIEFAHQRQLRGGSIYFTTAKQDIFIEGLDMLCFGAPESRSKIVIRDLPIVPTDLDGTAMIQGTLKLSIN